MAAGRPVSKLGFRAKGGPSRYRIGLDADLVDATVALDATVERGARHIGLEAEGRGTIQKHPWKVAIKPTTVTFTGDVDTKGIELELSGQELEARGDFSKRGGTLEFETGTIELGNCPYDALVGEHRDLVCGMNLAWAGGVLEGLGDDPGSARSDPAEGRCCVVFDPPGRAGADG